MLELTQIVANVATLFGLIGVFIAYRQFKAGVEAQKRDTAINAWTEYLKLALQHPDLARPQAWMTGHGIDSPKFREYRWFVAIMLFASEQILEAHPGDQAWKDIVEGQMRNHRGFLETSYFDSKVYSNVLGELAANVKGNHLNSDAVWRIATPY
jgi:hypothetical protein